MTALPVYPFDQNRHLGSVCEVGPTHALVNLPKAASGEIRHVHGHRFGGGEVGEFVMIDVGAAAVFARLTNVRLPERDRGAADRKMGKADDATAVGTVQLLTTILLAESRVSGGISVYPRLGDKVYSAHPELLKWLTESTGSIAEQSYFIDLASLPSSSDTRVRLTPERLFGRHCAVLGATGGGKSWTLGRLIEQSARQRSKILLLDATGEFAPLRCDVKHVHVGSEIEEGSDAVSVPYNELTEADLFAVFTPSGQSQAPKLRAAMKSLKLALLEPGLATGGVIQKAGKSRIDFETKYRQHIATIELSSAHFNVLKLGRQIEEECVWPTDRQNAGNWGSYIDSDKAYCVTLINRIEGIVRAAEFAPIFKTKGTTSIFDEIDKFLADDSLRVLRISLKYLPFSYNLRELVANAISRRLLLSGRTSEFREKPLLIVLDEAHHFLNKALGDEANRYALDSFDLIAKEGRKFSLTICIATQRPRDIPEGVLSQMGTLIVHRLINDRDREVVERASGDIDRSAAAFLPTLAPGQAILIGVDFSVPVTIQITPPDNKPDSKGPDYQQFWSSPPTVPIRTKSFVIKPAPKTPRET